MTAITSLVFCGAAQAAPAAKGDKSDAQAHGQAHSARTHPAPTAESEETAATVVSVDVEGKRIVVDHEPIPSLHMAAMKMPFLVDDTAKLSGLKVGDRVMITAVRKDGRFYAQSIRRR